MYSSVVMCFCVYVQLVLCVFLLESATMRDALAIECKTFPGTDAFAYFCQVQCDVPKPSP